LIVALVLDFKVMYGGFPRFGGGGPEIATKYLQDSVCSNGEEFVITANHSEPQTVSLRLHLPACEGQERILGYLNQSRPFFQLSATAMDVPRPGSVD